MCNTRSVRGEAGHGRCGIQWAILMGMFLPDNLSLLRKRNEDVSLPAMMHLGTSIANGMVSLDLEPLEAAIVHLRWHWRPAVRQARRREIRLRCG